MTDQSSENSNRPFEAKSSTHIDPVALDLARSCLVSYSNMLKGNAHRMGPSEVERAERAIKYLNEAMAATQNVESIQSKAETLLRRFQDWVMDTGNDALYLEIVDCRRALQGVQMMECRSITARRYIEHWHIDGLRDLRLIVSDDDAAAIKAACNRYGHFTFHLQSTDCGSVDEAGGDDA